MRYYFAQAGKYAKNERSLVDFSSSISDTLFFYDFSFILRLLGISILYLPTFHSCEECFQQLRRGC